MISNIGHKYDVIKIHKIPIHFNPKKIPAPELKRLSVENWETALQHWASSSVIQNFSHTFMGKKYWMKGTLRSTNQSPGKEVPPLIDLN